MSALRRRLQKLEVGRRGFRLVYVPDQLRGLDRAAFIEDYRREHGIPPGERIVALEESDRGA